MNVLGRTLVYNDETNSKSFSEKEDIFSSFYSKD